MSEARRGRRLPFVILPWSLLEDDTLTAHDILIYATLARYADHATGVAWPSRSTVALQARCDIKTVDRCIARLVEAGYVDKTKRQHEAGESNLYVLHEIAARQETLNPRSRGRGTNGAGVGAQTVRPLATQTVRELEPIQLDHVDPSEWAPMPDDIRARLTETTGSTA